MFTKYIKVKTNKRHRNILHEKYMISTTTKTIIRVLTKIVSVVVISHIYSIHSRFGGECSEGTVLRCRWTCLIQSGVDWKTSVVKFKTTMTYRHSGRQN